MLHMKNIFHEEIIEKESEEQSLMDNFSIDNIKDLEKLEKSLTDAAKHKVLVSIL